MAGAYQAILSTRLANQCITKTASRDPSDLVRWFGAVQAQEYPSAMWALAVRSRRTARSLEEAFNSGDFVRTHALRPTWHFVAASDLDWILDLTAPRIQRSLSYAFRSFGVDSATRRRAARLVEKAFRNVPHLTRAALKSVLGKARLPVSGTALGLLTIDLELERITCSGPLCGRQHTYAAYGSRVRAPRRLPRDEALAELTRRYLQSHGPATARDFAWWSGLTMADARRGAEMIGASCVDVDERRHWMLGEPAPVRARRHAVHLLPIYDEYLVAYRDREAITADGTGRMTNPLGPMLVVDGLASGTWRATANGNGIKLLVNPIRRLSSSEREGIEECAERYQRFSGRAVTLAMCGCAPSRSGR